VIWPGAFSDITGSPTVTSIVTSANGSKLAVASSSGSQIQLSSDSGVTWSAQTDAGMRAWQDIWMSPDGNTVYAVTTGSFWYTRNFGTSWSNVTPPTENSSGFWPSTSWIGVSASADGRVVMLGQGSDSTGPIVSVDSGLTWTRRAIHTGTAPTYQGAVAADGSLLVQTRWNDATTRGLWVSRDLGVSWTKISTVEFADVALSANRQKIVATTRSGRKA
jgi:hypothetical protein